MTQIRLTRTESELANWLAEKRYTESREAGIPDELAADRDPVENETYSFEAELAVAKMLNIYPSFEDRVVGYDLTYVGYHLDVKFMPQGFMSVRADRDLSEKVYVGVMEIGPWLYDVVGWIAGKEVQKLPARRGVRPGAPPWYFVKAKTLKTNWNWA